MELVEADRDMKRSETRAAKEKRSGLKIEKSVNMIITMI